MKFVKVTAVSFGPLHGEELELGPGLNVVVGPNEARKSSWHGAMYAGLCGRRRGKGRSSGEDQAFEGRHRPWNRSDWAVRAEIILDDGRNIELRHDLDGRRSEVTDLEFGRPVDDDIVFEGSPDGARWLGLDRRTFLATACIRQAEILAVADEPTGLRQLLQRAASTLGGDMTAAAAIESINSFRREHVGRDQANSVRPLRKARQALISAAEQHDRAVDAHNDYQLLVAQVDQASTELEAAESDVQRAEAASLLAKHNAEVAELDRIIDLAAQVEEFASEPSDGGDLDAVREALAQLSVTIAPRPLTGPTCDDLSEEIAAVPAEHPFSRIDQSRIADAINRMSETRSVAKGYDGPTEPPVLHPDLERAVEVAKVASAPTPSTPLGLVAEYERLIKLTQAHRNQIRYARFAIRVAAAVAVGAIVVALIGAAVIGAVVGGSAVLIAGAAALLMRSTDGDATLQLAEAQQALAEREAAVVQHVEWAQSARRWLSERELPHDPARAAAVVATRRADHAEYLRWVERSDSLDTAADSAGEHLLEMLADVGIVAESPDAAVRLYQEGVELAETNARQRSVLPQLKERRRAREVAESQYQLQLARRSAAGTLLIGAVATLGRRATDPDHATELAEQLIADQDTIRQRQLDAERLRAGLVARLDGRDLAGVEARRNELVTDMAGRTDGVDLSDVSADIEGARARRSELSESLAESRGRLNSIDDRSIDTAAALAEVEMTTREVERVERLGETLDLTCGYLEAAQAEAYRTVAPKIAAEVNAHLAHMTGGRYTDARVDPEQLTVRVRDSEGVLRDADRLSHGTAEQIHLLLRLAMARTLTVTGESCPILIDDATVHADSSRTDAVLSVLLELAEERQVVLFSQEDHVRHWATEHLSGEAHRIIDLEAV